MGFLHTGATFTADLNLLVQIAMGVALLVGARLVYDYYCGNHRTKTGTGMTGRVIVKTH